MNIEETEQGHYRLQIVGTGPGSEPLSNIRAFIAFADYHQQQMKSLGAIIAQVCAVHLSGLICICFFCGANRWCFR